MNTDTPEDIAFRESKQKIARFDEMVKDMDKDDHTRTKWHRLHDGMANV